jgi:hypothetical protein
VKGEKRAWWLSVSAVVGDVAAFRGGVRDEERMMKKTLGRSGRSGIRGLRGLFLACFEGLMIDVVLGVDLHYHTCFLYTVNTGTLIRNPSANGLID